MDGLDLCNLPGDVTPNDEVGIDARRAVLDAHSPSTRIRDFSKSWLWIAAIGQPDGVENKVAPPVSTYSESSIASPIALAQADNVVLVSACDENCDISYDVGNDMRQVWSRANRGSSNYRPHVIAPGGIGYLALKDNKLIGGMPGFGREGTLMRAYGTSQSAAFVAGLASKMLSCYPRQYLYKSKLKEALQFTSMPVLPSAPHWEDLVATGLVDIKMALRNPGYIYLLKPGAGAEPKRVETTAARWCAKKIMAKSYDGQTIVLETKKIRRLVRLYSGPTARFIAYTHASSGKIERSAALIGTIESEAPILAINAKKLKLKDLKDLLVFNELVSSADGCEQ